MLPGPTIIFKCPSCNQLLKRLTIASGNTGGAKYWTDGWMSARMLPLTPRLIKCAQCSAVNWLALFEVVDSYETYFGLRAFSGQDREIDAKDTSQDLAAQAKLDLYKDVPCYETATSDEIFNFADGASLTLEQDFQVRVMGWQRGNDLRRNSVALSPFTNAELRNLQKVLSLMVQLKSGQSLLMVEALRELGRLTEAKELILKTTFNRNETKAAQFILELIEVCDTKVRQVR
jgi:hypothetical protein